MLPNELPPFQHGHNAMKSTLATILLCTAFGSACLSQSQGAYWGTPSVDGGKCCSSLEEVRKNIDRLDREIVGLMAERGKYVAEAGRFKADPAAVSVPARVNEIIEKIKMIASGDGLPPMVAERTYRAMIAAFEDYERDISAARRTGEAAKQKP
jgi:isochorismate pyruvate lyase